MADTTLADALLLLTKVSDKLNDRTVELQRSIDKTVGTSVSTATANTGKKQPEKIVKKSEPVIVTDFGVKAEQDLRDNLSPSSEEDGKDGKPGGGSSFLKKLIGPALLVLGGIAALVTGLMTDGPLKGFLKILAKGGIIGGIKLFAATAGKSLKKFGKLFAKILPKNLFKTVVTTAKGFLSKIGKFLLAPFAKLAGKGGAKALFGTIGKLFFKFLKPVLKRIPGIGSLISWGFAISRFKKGDLVGGLIDVASGIATLFPGIGTGISIGLDVLNAFLDVKKGKEDGVKPEGAPGGIGAFFGKIKDKILDNFPLKNLIQFWTGVGKVFKGDFKEGFKQMAFAIPFMEPLSNFLFDTVAESKDESGKFSFKSFFGNIKNKLLNKMVQILPKSILGVSVQARVAKMLGVDVGPVEDDMEAIEAARDENTKEIYGEYEGMSAAEQIAAMGQEPGTEKNTGITLKQDMKDVNVSEANQSISQRNDEIQNISGNMLDKDTFVNFSKVSLKVNQNENKLLQMNNSLLSEILEKINTNNTIVNNTSNNSVSQSNDNSSVRQFRERYA
jgi:hypothetical protein